MSIATPMTKLQKLEAELGYVRSQIDRTPIFSQQWLMWLNREAALVALIARERRAA